MFSPTKVPLSTENSTQISSAGKSAAKCGRASRTDQRRACSTLMLRYTKAKGAIQTNAISPNVNSTKAAKPKAEADQLISWSIACEKAAGSDSCV